MSSEAETQPPAAPVPAAAPAAPADSKPNGGTGNGGSGLASAAPPAGGDKKVIELLFTLAELTLFQLLSRSMTSCGVSTFLVGAEGVCGLMSCRVLTTRVQETADQSGKTCTGVTDHDSAEPNCEA
ncbi:hypothetical protein HGM15179_001931 [Zosterops borbonicus]|uniref:Uncharacterized protein n=1 Tax=Zosterops borbonicus TaxID=364589 RepID=A0A8K1GTT4_9PASS|nr:hypothetical protein HGM15179_001931 [Zosterops borbonicus]